MARRGWARSIFLAAFAAAAAAAAQLGLGYGLGIVAWTTSDGGPSARAGAWTATLAWTTWLVANSVVVGALVADRSRQEQAAGGARRARAVRQASAGGPIWRVGISLAATLGAATAVPLVAIPAARAQIADNFAPHLLAGIYAVVGAVVGLAVAVAALSSRAIAANVSVNAGWLWLLAVIALVDGLSWRSSGYGQLAVWKFTDSGPMWHAVYIPGALQMLGACLLIGGLAAYPAAVRGERRVGVAISGAFGPLLVAVAYSLSSPEAGQAPVEQLSAFYVAPYLVVAGLAGSMLVAAVGGAPRARRVTLAQPDALPGPG